MDRRFPVIFLCCLSVLFASAQYCGNSGTGQCTPAGSYSTPGFYPTSANLAPFNNHVAVDTVLQFKVPSSISTLPVSTVRMDSLTNLPPGLCWSSNMANNTFSGGSVACIHITGIPCAATGQYKLNFYFYVNAIITASYTGDALGIKYFMRLKNPADAAVAVDTTQLASHPIILYGAQCPAITPVTVNLGADRNLTCIGNVNLSAAITGGVAPYTYSWQFTGDSLSCTNCSSPVAYINRNSSYVVTVTDYFGSHASDTINCNLVTDGNFVLSSAAGTCLGDTLKIAGAYIPGQIIWTENGVPIDTVYVGYTFNNTVGRITGTNQAISAVFIDKNGYAYVSDADYGRVTKFPPGNNGQTPGVIVAGAGGTFTGQLNQLNSPQDVFVDPAGYIYVADLNNYRVLRFPPNSDSSTMGTIVAGGNGGGGALNSVQPGSICVDSAGNLYVSDWYNDRVLKFPPNSNSTTNGVVVAGGNGSGSAANQFYQVNYVRLDKNGNLYVSDYGNNRVQKFPAGSISSTNGTTVAGGNGAGSGLNQLYNPMSIYIDAQGNLFVADWGNSRFMKFGAGSNQSSYGTAFNTYPSTAGIGLDTAGNVYVTDYPAFDTYLDEYKATINTGLRTTTAGTYSALISEPGGCMASANSISATATAQSQSLHIGVSQNNICAGTAVTFTATATVTGPDSVYQWKKNGVNVGTNSPVYTTSSIQNLDSVWCTLVISGACTSPQTAISNVIHMTWNIPAVSITASTGNICQGSALTLTGSGLNLGSSPVYTWHQNGNVVGSNSNLLTLSSISDQDTFQLYVHLNPVCPGATDTFSNRLVITVFPVPAVTLGTLGGRCNDTLALTGASASSKIVWQYSGNGIDSAFNHQHSNSQYPGIVAAGGNGRGTQNNQLFDPNHIFIDRNDYLYVTDYYNIKRFPPRSTSATNGHVKWAVPGAVGGFVDSSGYMYFIFNHFVYKLPPNSDSTTAGGSALAGTNTFNQQTNSWQFLLSNPTDVWVDKTGYIYVADAGNYVIFKFPPNNPAAPSIVAGGNGPGSGINQLSNVVGVVVDNAGYIYGVDKGNNRVVRFIQGPPPVVIAGNHGANLIPSPLGIGFDTAGALFVGGNFCSVQKFAAGSDSTTVPVTVAGTTGSCGTSFNQLFNSGNIAFDSKGNMYVLDEMNNRVMKYFTEIDTLHEGASNGNYTAVITTQEGCRVTSNTFNLNPIRILPVTVSANTATTICPGTAVTFTAAGQTGLADSVYQWYVNGAATGTNNKVFNTSSIQNNDSVWCTLSISAGCGVPALQKSNVMHFTVLVKPALSITAAAASICHGDTLKLSGQPVNLGSSPVYTWKKNGSVTVDNNDTLYTTAVANRDSFKLYIQSNTVCWGVFDTFSNSIPVTVYSIPVVSLGGSGGICPDTLLLSGATSAAGIQWYRNGTLVKTSYPVAVGPAVTFVGTTNNPEYSYPLISPFQVSNPGRGFIINVLDVANGTVMQKLAHHAAFNADIFTNAGINLRGMFGGAGGNFLADSVSGNIMIWDNNYGFNETEGTYNGISSLYANPDQSVYVADAGNNRIVHYNWGSPATNVIGGGNGAGSALNQLNNPRGIAGYGDSVILV